MVPHPRKAMRREPQATAHSRRSAPLTRSGEGRRRVRREAHRRVLRWHARWGMAGSKRDLGRSMMRRRAFAPQLSLPFGAPTGRTEPATAAGQRGAPTMAVTAWPRFMGRKAPPPLLDEPPLNTKRAAHYLRRSSRWLELVRFKVNSPPWVKVGGIYEYYQSQLDWWREQIADL